MVLHSKCVDILLKHKKHLLEKLRLEITVVGFILWGNCTDQPQH